jgi:hypothetical protein
VILLASPVPISDEDRLLAASDYRKAATDCTLKNLGYAAKRYAEKAKELEPLPDTSGLELDIPVDIDE